MADSMKNTTRIIYLTLYVLIQNGAVTTKSTYEGMEQVTVDRLLKEKQSNTSGMTYQFVDKKTFDSTPELVLPPLPVDPVKQKAILDAKSTAKTPQERLDALIKAVGL